MTQMVRDALKNSKGVISSEVDWDTGDAVLLYDETVVSFETIKQVFERAGFTVSKHVD